jgi:hypothetical protein
MRVVVVLEAAIGGRRVGTDWRRSVFGVRLTVVRGVI